MKIPGMILKQFIPDALSQISDDIPKDWNASSKEARCVIQLSEWWFKRIPDLEALRPIAKGIAYKCDTDPEKRNEMRQGLKDLYLLLDSYHVGD